MATNAQRIREFQRKIDSIITDFPPFVARLELVLYPETVRRLLEYPPLGQLCMILVGTIREYLSPPVTDDVVSVESLNRKMEEYRSLKSDVIIYFERLLTLVDYALLSGLCHGTILSLGDEKLFIIDVYDSYLNNEPDEEVEAGNDVIDLSSDTSSDDDI